MKREQKAFVMLMAACMAFTGISSLMSASAAPVSLKQAQIGNYLDDGGNWHSFEGDRLLRTYVEHRPDRRFIELQSHPLLIPDKVDSWLVAEVC